MLKPQLRPKEAGQRRETPRWIQWLTLTVPALALPCVIQAVEPPVGLWCAPVSTNSIRVEWGDVSSDETGFVVERSRDLVRWQAAATLPANTTNWMDSGLDSATLYQYRIHPVNAPGRYSNWNFASTLRPVRTGQADHSIATASWQPDNRIVLTWTDPYGDETGWVVTRRYGPTGDFIPGVSLPANTTTWVDDDPHPPDTAVAYCLSSTWEGGETPPLTVTASVSYNRGRPQVTQWSASSAPPSNLRLAHASPTAYVLEWDDNSTNESSFAVLRSWNGVDYEETGSVASNRMCWTNAAAMAGIPISYRVMAIGPASLPSDSCLAVTALPDPDIPMPGGLAGAPEGSGSAVDWINPGAGETAIIVEQFAGAGWNEIASLDPSITRHVVGTTGRFRVRCRRGNDWSPATSSVWVQAATSLEPTPTGLMAVALSPTSVRLDWLAPEGGAACPGVAMQRSTDGVAWFTVGLLSPAAVGTARSFTNDTCRPATPYRYRLALRSDPERHSGEATATTPPATGAPPAPTGLSAVAASRKQVNLSWTDAALNESGYRVERSDDGGASWTNVTDGPANRGHFADTGLVATSEYLWRVSSLTNGIVAHTSAQVAATTLSSDPIATAGVRSRTSFSELLVTGTAANDRITLAREGVDVVVKRNGLELYRSATPIGQAVIYGQAGDDELIVEPSYEGRSILYGGDGGDVLRAQGPGRAILVAVGGGHDRLYGNRRNTSFWADEEETDEIYASPAEVASGRVHPIQTFQSYIAGLPFSPVTVQPDKVLNGPNYPSEGIYWSAGSAERLPGSAFWGEVVSPFDVNQGNGQDCPLTSLFSGMAYGWPDGMEELGVDLGDGTYAVNVHPDFGDLCTRIDADVNNNGSLARVGFTGSQWFLLIEKLIFGLYQPVALRSDGNPATGTIFGLDTDSMPAFEALRAALARGEVGSCGSQYLSVGGSLLGAAVPAGHVHSAFHAFRDVNGDPWVIVRNPYGINYEFNYGPLDPHLGLRLMTWDQFRHNFPQCHLGTARFVRPPSVMATENPDTDAYGLPDWWKESHFGSINGPGTGARDDWDGDGMSNEAEWVAGTHPADMQSRLEITGWRLPIEGGLDLTWSSVVGRRYRVERSTNLLEAGVTTVSSNIPGAGSTTLFTLPAPEGDRGFLRVRVEE